MDLGMRAGKGSPDGAGLVCVEQHVILFLCVKLHMAQMLCKEASIQLASSDTGLRYLFEHNFDRPQT